MTIVFIILLVFVILLGFGFKEYLKTVNSWRNPPSISEYMSTLLFGWACLFGIVIGGIIELVFIVIFIIELF